jgi:hypothetical protein
MTSAVTGTGTATQPSLPSCARCAHVAADGSWGAPYGLTHCRRCHRDWRMGSPPVPLHPLLRPLLGLPGRGPPHDGHGLPAAGRGAHQERRAPARARPERYGPIWRLAGQNPWARGTHNVPGEPCQR